MSNCKIDNYKKNIYKKKDKRNCDREISYDSDLVQKVNDATIRQAQQVNDSGFASQFDTISLSNTESVGINQSNVIKRDNESVFNLSLQRDLDFDNGYSEFLPSQMHYGVTQDMDLMISNMSYHSAKRDVTNINRDHSHRLALNTGVDPFYKSKDCFDPVNIIEPMKNLTYVNGAPVFTDFLESRYIPSSKNNNGDLPFSNNLKVLPGIKGNIDPANTVYRSLPRNVDELRSKTNPKITYKADKVESGLKGELRASDYHLTKYKKKSYRDRDFGDFLPSSAPVNKRKVDGKVKTPNTNRSVSKSEFGHLNKTSKGLKHIGKYTEAAKTTFIDDSISRAVSNVENKPVMQNKQSYSNDPNERSFSNYNEPGVAHHSTSGNYTIDSKDIPLTTLRQLLIDGDTNLGVMREGNKQSYAFSKDMVLPVNNRMSTSQNNLEPSLKSQVNASYSLDYNDLAKQTIKETTIDNQYIGQANPEMESSYYFDINDTAKQTIKETTIDNKYIGQANPEMESSYYFDPTDITKQTIRQTTEVAERYGNINPEYKSSQYFDPTNITKQTIRQTTGIAEHYGNVNPEMKSTNYYNPNSKARPTIKQTTENNKFEGILNVENKTGHYYNPKDKARPTVKQTTSSLVKESNIQPTYAGPNYVNYENKAKPTIKETTEKLTQQGNVSNIDGNVGYYFDPKEKARPTIKSTTLYSQKEQNISSTHEANYIRALGDEAKKTVKETTLSQLVNTVIGKESDGKTYVKDYDDKAKTTIKETTLSQLVNTVAGKDSDGKTYVKDYDDKAKTTIKETTLHNGRGNAGVDTIGYYKDNNFNAKPTIKQSTLIKNRTGPVLAEVEKNKSQEAERNMQIDDRREILTYNRTPNKKGKNAIPKINKKELVLKEENFIKRDAYGCDTNNSNSNRLKQAFTRNKVLLNNEARLQYRIDKDFISTLDNNPLVNDIMHQKNK